MNVYLLKTYNGKNPSSIVEVDEAVGKKLIADGIARLTTGRDYLVKPEFTLNKVVSRTFKRSPKIK